MCIDDFAIKKREKYGTIMVDIETHKVIDILESRELNEVALWLQSFPNLDVVSRDGSITYRNAIETAHPNAIQVSDRFHLLKNLTDYCTTSLKRIFPTRVAIKHSAPLPIIKSPEDSVKINRRMTLEEKYKKCVKLKQEGKSQTEICKSLNIDCRVFKKLIQLSETEAKTYFSTKTDSKRALTLLDKIEKVKLVKKLHMEGHSNRKIAKLTGFSKDTVGKYLDKDFSPIRKETSRHIVSILDPYLTEIETKLSEGYKASEIEKTIREKGYTGSSSTFRHYCSNWKKQLNESKPLEMKVVNNNTEYILRKNIMKLLYWPINKISTISKLQYQLLRKQYTIFADIIDLLNKFRDILKTQSIDELTPWIDKVKSLDIKELHSFCKGIERDLDAVKNAIMYSYNNGLAEGSVNKLKVIKRIMYGRCSFELLKAKLLRLEKMR